MIGPDSTNEPSRPDADPASVTDFQQHILAWYDTFKRDLPWRGDPKSLVITLCLTLL